MRTLILKLAFEKRREAREPHQMLREEEEEEEEEGVGGIQGAEGSGGTELSRWTSRGESSACENNRFQTFVCELHRAAEQKLIRGTVVAIKLASSILLVQLSGCFLFFHYLIHSPVESKYLKNQAYNLEMVLTAYNF